MEIKDPSEVVNLNRRMNILQNAERRSAAHCLVSQAWALAELVKRSPQCLHLICEATSQKSHRRANCRILSWRVDQRIPLSDE